MWNDSPFNNSKYIWVRDLNSFILKKLLQILKWAHYICWFSRGITASFSSKEFLLWRSKDVFNICKLGYTTFAILEPLFFGKLKIVKTTFKSKKLKEINFDSLFDAGINGLRAPNEDINQRYLKKWANEAGKICFGHI